MIVSDEKVLPGSGGGPSGRDEAALPVASALVQEMPKGGWKGGRTWVRLERTGEPVTGKGQKMANTWKNLMNNVDLDNPHHFSTMYIWDVLNLNANRMRRTEDV